MVVHSNLELDVNLKISHHEVKHFEQFEIYVIDIYVMITVMLNPSFFMDIIKTILLCTHMCLQLSSRVTCK